MIERKPAFEALAEFITDELVVTGIGPQSNFWFMAKHRPENFYLRGPMGLAPAVGLGVALACPQRRVVAIEGDGSLLMSLSSLIAIAHSRPNNFMLICMDNGIYESGGKGLTPNAGRTDYIKTAQGIGIPVCRTADDLDSLKLTVRDLLSEWECSFLHVRIAPIKSPVMPLKLKPFEIKHHFSNALRQAV